MLLGEAPGRMRKGGGEMKYPDHLVKQVKERSAPYQLEGF